MLYCPFHATVYMPAGYSPPAGMFLPAEWVPLSAEVWRWAQIASTAFPAQVQCIPSICDACRAPQEES